MHQGVIIDTGLTTRDNCPISAIQHEIALVADMTPVRGRLGNKLF